MSQTIIDFSSIVDELRLNEISDETLEAAADAEMAASYTLGACTGLSVCPA